MTPATLLMLVVSATLILRTGERIDVTGPIREVDGQVIFRVPGGTLYSLPASEIDQEGTRALEEARRKAADPAPRKLKVTPEERDRLLADLAKNRNGQQPEPQRSLTQPPPAPSRAEQAAERDAEWEWRQRARTYEEDIRRAEEELQLLRNRIDELESEIRGLVSLGYAPRQFSYQTTVLVTTKEQIPAAELAVTQARRAYDQFREDARRAGVMPGWLR
ncbi:MAG: hypothetical protein ACXW2P_02890 [Thermoanaerobaculia bacterium]